MNNRNNIQNQNNQENTGTAIKKRKTDTNHGSAVKKLKTDFHTRASTDPLYYHPNSPYFRLTMSANLPRSSFPTTGKDKPDLEPRRKFGK